MTKQKTMTIYQVSCHEAYAMYEQYEWVYSLMPWEGDDQYYKGDDDGGEEYIIPEGYEVAEDTVGTLRLYDKEGHYHDIVGKTHPAFHDNYGNLIRLAKADK